MVSMDSIYRTLLDLSTLYVCDDEAFGARNKVIGLYEYNLIDRVGQSFGAALFRL